MVFLPEECKAKVYRSQNHRHYTIKVVKSPYVILMKIPYVILRKTSPFTAFCVLVATLGTR